MTHSRLLVVFALGILVLGMSLGASAQCVKTDQETVVDSQLLNVPVCSSAIDVEPGADKFMHRDGDDFKSPQSIEQFQRRQEALKQRLAGKGAGKIHEVAKGQYVELGLERTDRIFVIIVEYGNSAGAGLSTGLGPLHNQIPEPNRALDNNTIWQPDFNKSHFEDIYNNQMADYYRTQSSGRYTLGAQVTEWVKVPFNGSRYGANSMGDAAAWTLIADAINTWTRDRLAEGMTIDEIKAYLQTFDTWDRYDYDKDGDFNEPDGYIDHFQIVHAGAGEETGGGTLGADAIWSHRWFAFYNWRGTAGPSFNKYGGLEFGGGWGANPSGTTSGSSSASVGPTRATVTNAYPVTPTGIFVGDYTIQPENGGLGVFAHEYGHDLGLPDHYDTNGGNNGAGFWNIMASGSYLGDGTVDIGSRPGDMVAWDKLQLGWLNYDVAYTGRFSSHRLGPAETNTKAAQGLVVVLPPEKNVFYLYTPIAGSLAYGTHAFWGGKGDLIDYNMTRQVTIPAAPAVLSMQVNYQIETNWDYAYVSVSTDSGATWTNLAGTYLNSTGGQSNLTTTSNPNGQNLGNGITGSSNGAWRLASFNMNAYAGQTVLLRLRYKTDEYTNLKGFMVDEIRLGSFYDGAEGDNTGWTFSGFKVTTGIEVSNAPHYYVAEFRQYRTYDQGLQTGPYTFGFADRPDYVAHYPYQDGLLITYWDTGETNDNTSQHPGEGRSLPIDAHPDPLIRVNTWPNGNPLVAPWSATVQTYDSTFGLQPTDVLDLPYVGTYSGTRLQFWQTHPSLPAVPVFNDMNPYWSPTTAASSVIVPSTGTIIRVVSTSAQDSFMQVHVESPK
jgi:immune inhibitor A